MAPSAQTSLLLKYPSSWWGARWREALPSGNGTLGAAVYGAVHDETILLTHEDLWHRARTESLPDVSSRLPEIRRLLAEEQVEEADRVLADELQRLGYDPRVGTPLPLGDLKIRMPVQAGFRDYRRSLNMETGEVEVAWVDQGVSYRRRLFVSRPDDLVVMEITGSRPSLTAEVGLDLHDRSDVRSATGERADLPADLAVQADESGWIRYAARHESGTDFGAVARIVPCGGNAASSKCLRIRAAKSGLHIENAERIMIVVKMFVEGDRHSAWPELQRELDDVTMDYPALLAPHVAEHGDLFSRVRLDLGGRAEDHALSNEELLLEAYQGEASRAMVEKMWAYGRYLLVSSSRSGGQPCPLHGKWSGAYLGFWTFHMANENLQMIYWQSLSGQLAETLLPVFDYYDQRMDEFRENARKLYGCRGIYIPAVSTPESGLLKTLLPHIIHWTGAAGWLAQHYYDYYVYTGDEDFLRERAFPFLRETAKFFEDFFTVDATGFYQSAPSVSPENEPGNYWDGKGMGAGMETAMNATMDFALAKEVLTHLIDATRILGEGGDEIADWARMLDRIPPYQINEDGAVREWMHPFFTDNYHHRHQSHIYPVFPGTEITPTSDPDLFAAFVVAIQKRLKIGIGEQTGWSLAHMANVYARMKDGDQSLNCLDLIARSCLKNNFYTTHNDWRNMGIGVEMAWAPFQIDANMGWSAAIQEMLLFSLPGQISVLPALPGRWQRGAVTGLMARGGVRVSITWNVPAGEVQVDLCSIGKTQAVIVDLPFGETRHHRVELVADQVKRIGCQGAPPEPVPAQTT